MATCKLVGLPCATYGPYTFYKAFKYTKNGKANILSLSEFFFVKLWSDSDLVSIGELTLLWEDRNSEQTLACLRLYILPENTPDGRNDIHGEDEVLSITEKVVLRLEDLLTWLTDDADWSWGLGALWQGGAKKTATPTSLNSLNACCASIDFSDVEREKEALGADHWETNPGVIVLSFTRYCRYRGLLRRFEGSTTSSWLTSDDVIALGGFHAPYKNTKVLFCKDTFDYPDLEGHELLCNHLAPKYKGRTKKRKKLLITNVDSDSGSESSSTVSSNNNNNNNKSPNKSGLRVRLNPSRKSPRISDSQHERDFLHRLYQFMKTRKTPIGKVPTIGFKELDLYKLFHKVKHLGGYEEVTTGRLWKYVFAEVGGEQGTTSSGTLSRKHYERLLLPYEKHMSSGAGADKDAPAGKSPGGKGTPHKPGKVNGNVPIQPGRKEKESPVITLEESSDSSSNSNSNPTSCGNGSDKPTNFSIVKRKIVMEGNSSSLRNARLKLEKPQHGAPQPPSTPAAQEAKPEVKTNGQVSPPRDKENIPLVNKAGEKRLAPPEVIDISEDSGPQSINAFKKQKLDILKYQGLEVTPVSSEDVKPPIAHPPPSLPPAPLLHPPEFPQRERNKISITVTPDVSLLIKPQASPPPPPPPPPHHPHPLPALPPLPRPSPANLFTPSPYQPGPKPVYGNPKEVLSNPKEPPTYPSPKEQVYNNPKEIFSSPKDLFSSPKDIYNKPKELFNSPKDLYSHPMDLFSSQKDLLNSSKEMYSNSKDLFSSQKELYHSPKNLFNSPKELYNNPPKELLYPNAKDIFNTSAGRDSFTKSKDNFSPISTKDSFNNTNSLKDMFSPNNLKELLTNPGFRDMLGNPNFKDFFSNPTTLKDPSPHLYSEDVLDLKVKPHPALPPTLKQRPPPQQDEVLDLTVRGGKKELEITLLPSSHRPYEMKRPLPLPLTRAAASPSLHKNNHSLNQQHSFKKNISNTPPSSQSFASHSSLHNSHSSQHHSHSSLHNSQHNSHSSQPSSLQNSHSSQQSLSHNSHSSQHNSHSSQHNSHSSQHNPHSSHNRSKRKSSSSGSSVPVPPTSRPSSFPSPHSKPPTPSSSSSSPSPYLPMLDPMYFAALYSGLFPPNFMNPAAAALFSPPVSAPSGSAPQDAALNMYKELLKAQNSSLFSNLFNSDGGTSISLVGNNSKPSPK